MIYPILTIPEKILRTKSDKVDKINGILPKIATKTQDKVEKRNVC